MNETDERRAQRLKAALQDNLKRRKDQARGRAVSSESEPGQGNAHEPKGASANDPLSDKTDL
ncbi:hypothetical protein [Methylobacterium iners]|nr:hypothetical protein [Methylobacterium iners]